MPLSGYGHEHTKDYTFSEIADIVAARFAEENAGSYGGMTLSSGLELATDKTDEWGRPTFRLHYTLNTPKQPTRAKGSRPVE